MSDESREKLAQQFYVYRFPSNVWSLGEKRESINRKMAALARSLLNPEISPHADVWARYFLLVLRHTSVGDRASDQQSYPSPVSYGDIVSQLDEAIAPLATHYPELHQIHQYVKQQSVTAAKNSFFQSPRNMSRELLTMHLHPKCYYLAYVAARRWFNKEDEAFSLLQENICDPTRLLRLLKSFELDRPKTSIRTYAEKKLAKQLDARRLAESGQFQRFKSGWGQLRYLAKKELIRVLQNDGKDDLTIQQYRLIWQCFKECYTTRQTEKQGQLPPPTKQQLQQMCDRYHQRQTELGLSTTLTMETVQTRLDEIIESVRHYEERFSFESIDGNVEAVMRHLTADDLSKSGLSTQPSSISSLKSSSYLETLMLAEVKAYLSTLTHQAFEQRTLDEQRLFILEAGLRLSRQMIAELLQVNPSTISRRWRKYQAEFLSILVEAVKQQNPEIFHQCHDHDPVIAQLQELMNIYLERHCQTLCCTPLAQTWPSLPSEQQQIIRYVYSLQLDNEALFYHLNLTDEQIDQQISRLNNQLQAVLVSWCYQKMKLILTHQHITPACIAQLLADWLNGILVLNEAVSRARIPSPLGDSPTVSP